MLLLHCMPYNCLFLQNRKYVYFTDNNSMQRLYKQWSLRPPIIPYKERLAPPTWVYCFVLKNKSQLTQNISNILL